jgi:hypothetical protein
MNHLPSRVLGVLGVLVMALHGTVAPSTARAAAPPPNDLITSPTRITGIPFTSSQDTRQATRSPDDGRCVSQASVWYRYRPATTGWARVVTVGSDHDTVLAVFRGTRNNRTLVRCDDDGVGLQSATSLRFVAGQTYWVALSSCCGASATGGRAELRLYRGRAADVSATIDAVESGGVSGRLALSGTITCTTPSLGAVEVTVSQRNGDQVARGYQILELDFCGPDPVPWRVVVDSDTGWAFLDGRAVVEATAFSFDGFADAERDLGGTVTVTEDPDARR